MKTILHSLRFPFLLSILFVVSLSNPEPAFSQKGPANGDNFGYTWTSSDQGGVAFNWVDIKSIGTEITELNGTDDNNVGPFPIGFNFIYFDSTYTDFRVCSNGFITFNSTNSEYSNYGLPGTTGEMIAAFWNDLNLGNNSNSHVYYYNDGSRLIVQYQVIPPYSGTGSYTFQIILYPNGRIVYQYLDMNGSDKSATIGWQNTDGSDGFTISLDDANFIHNNLAIQIKAGPKTPQNLIAVSGDQTITLTWDKSVDTTVTKYRIYGGTIPNPTTQIDSNTSVNDTTQMLTGLTNGITYYYRVTSVNDVTSDESGYSNQVSGRPSTRPELFVTTLTDGGVGSLRTAIDSANSHLGPDTICFEYSLKGGDIILDAGIFYLSDNGTVIDGDIDGDHKPDIGINGSNTYGELLTITSSDNVIKGLVVHGTYFSGGGSVYITGSSARNNVLLGNYFGTSMDGNSAEGRDFGIRIDGNAKNNKIGDGTPNGRNVISSNNGNGIDIYSSDSNYILHNYIGVTSDGLSSAGNSYRGVYLDNSNYVSMTGNVISGSGWDGVYINRSDSNVILGNFIGTDKEGMYAVGNGQTGITVENSDFNMIGDGTVIGRNVISGNSSNGISLYEGESGPVTNNKVEGNYIGTAADGFTPLGNSGNGVSLTACCSDVHYNAINHNTIAHNGSSGIYASDYDVRFNTFFQNSIYANGNGGIVLGDLQTQEGIAPPRITNITANSVSGEAAPGALIQVYADDFDQGEIYLDSTYADGSGVWSLSVTVPINRNITALQDSNGSTSAFSFPFTGNSDSLLVSKIADNGSVGTLRVAIEYANYHAGRDSIKFAIPGGSVIDLYGDLPAIIDNQTVINGDLDQNGTPDIMIDGGGGARSSNGGLLITSSDNIIRGLAIGHCTDTYGGITLDGIGAINNQIVGNYLGTDLTGLAAAPNVYG
ncbi:right-handed parallel beta-helix repeat-containing protein, partial [bacterium]|nr:right-handed parallel beta-helix repeat-containing protein [bacterium]